MHLAWRAAAFDPSYGDLNVLTKPQRDIVWEHVDEEAKSILVMPKLSDDELENGFDRQGSALPGSVLCVRMAAIQAAQRFFRLEFERIAPLRREANQFSTLEYWRDVDGAAIIGLRPLAWALLSSPASSADSERSFSSAGFIDGSLRGRMNDEGIADLVFVRDWVLSENAEDLSNALRAVVERSNPN